MCGAPCGASSGREASDGWRRNRLDDDRRTPRRGARDADPARRREPRDPLHRLLSRPPRAAGQPARLPARLVELVRPGQLPAVRAAPACARSGAGVSLVSGRLRAAGRALHPPAADARVLLRGPGGAAGGLSGIPELRAAAFRSGAMGRPDLRAEQRGRPRPARDLGRALEHHCIGGRDLALPRADGGGNDRGRIGARAAAKARGDRGARGGNRGDPAERHVHPRALGRRRGAARAGRPAPALGGVGSRRHRRRSRGGTVRRALSGDLRPASVGLRASLACDRLRVRPVAVEDRGVAAAAAAVVP